MVYHTCMAIEFVVLDLEKMSSCFRGLRVKNSQPLGDVILTNKTLGSFTGIQP